MATLDVMEREGLVQRAVPVGQRLSAGLQALVTDGLVDHVRGAGAVWAVGLLEGRDPVAARDRILEAGAVVRPIAPSTLAMCPPLMIPDEDLDLLLAAVRAGVSA